MKYLIIISILISSVSNAECIKIRIDNTFSKEEVSVIKNALNAWTIVSKNKVCFNIIMAKILAEEMTIFSGDKVSTIYNNNLWQILFLLQNYAYFF